MRQTVLRPGADVVTPRGRGVVIDIRATASGRFVVGVEDAGGEVTYFTEQVLRLAQS